MGACGSTLVLNDLVGGGFSKEPLPHCVCILFELWLDGAVEKLTHGDPKIQEGVKNFFLALNYSFNVRFS